MSPEHWKPVGNGRPLPGVEIKLVEILDTPFQVPRYTRGEIHVRGASIPTHPQVPPDPNGWIRTSLIGQWDIVDKTFRLIGETANLGNRFLGDYVAVETLEEIYGQAEFVQESVIAYIFRRAYPIAILCECLLELLF